MKFLYRPINKNVYTRGKNPSIDFLVIHDTGNTGIGANALNHKNYVGTNARGASAHYFVDDKNIVQFVGDSKAAGAVGDGKGKFGITNRNSISIEMCINSDGDYEKTYKNTLELTKNLMVKFKIPIEKVVRHYDASRKICPGQMSKNNWQAWWKFKEDIKKPIEWKIDLDKDSTFGNNVIKEEKKMAEIKDTKPSEWAKDEWKEAVGLGITDGTNPQKPATREEVASMILRSLKLKKN